MEQLRVGILGPGGVGGLLAGTLAREGVDVVCIASPSTVAVLHERGLSVTSERFGSFRQDVSAEAHLSRSVDVLFITVKATALSAALDRIPEEILGDAVVVPFLNGLEHVELLRHYFPRARVVAATIRVETSRTAAGNIVQKSPFATIEFAPSAASLPDITALAALLSQANFDVQVRENEWVILWEKLSFLAPLALLTTVHEVAVGDLRTVYREELVEVLDEVAEVARAAGVPISLEQVLAKIAGAPSSMRSSMQLDAAQGRPIEIDAIGGAIVRAAQSAELAIPRVEALVQTLQLRYGDRGSTATEPA